MSFEKLKEIKYELMSRRQLIDEVKRLRTVNTDGWKGKDQLKFGKIEDTWYVIEHRKIKSNKKVQEFKHEVKQDTIDYLWDIIKLDTKVIGGKTSYRDLVPNIINKYDLDISVEEFNGGVNRATTYFPLYYYAMKILEHLGNVNYGGRGVITRLKQ